MRNPNLERKKNEKHSKFLGLNRPFIEDAHFENTMTNDLEILSGSKK
jgi:tRNA 2-selenouridine synthase SelU